MSEELEKDVQQPEEDKETPETGKTGSPAAEAAPTDAPKDQPAEEKPADAPEMDKAVAAEEQAAPDPKLINAELRAAAALAGVPAARISYAVRMAEMHGAEQKDADLGKLAAEAIAKVLADVPELKATAEKMPGSEGNFRRKPNEQPKDAFLRGLTGSN